MKLGEALTQRARRAQRLGDLQQRIQSSAIVQEGDDPAEDPIMLLREYEVESQELGKLVKNIQHTNWQTPVGGKRLAEVLQDRELLVRRRNIKRKAAEAASTARGYRYTRSEVKLVPQLEAGSLLKDAEDVEEQLRVLDARIQQINWATDLIAIA